MHTSLSTRGMKSRRSRASTMPGCSKGTPSRFWRIKLRAVGHTLLTPPEDDGSTLWKEITWLRKNNYDYDEDTMTAVYVGE